MGNCSGVCSKNLPRKKYDVIMDKLLEEKDNSKNVYTYNLYKIKFLQKEIKVFLKRKRMHKSNHSSNKSSKQNGNKRRTLQDKNNDNNLIIHYPYNSHSKKTSSKSQNIKNSTVYRNSIHSKSNKNDSSPKIRSPKNRSPKNKSPKNRSPKNRGKISSFPKQFKIITNNINDEYHNNLGSKIGMCKKNNNDENNGNNSIFIPILKLELFERELFKIDPFRNGVRKTKYDNDPRDIFDNIRKKYQKITEDNCSYIGEWKNGKRDGIGLLCWEKEKFLGYFIENNVNGYGRLCGQNGDTYKGYWKNYQADGWGIYYISKGAFFRGMWSKDKQNGFGVERWPRWSIFFGDYFMGNKNGFGILNFESKAWYEGQFKNGIISGIGSFFFEDGRRYQGMWKNNRMDGYGYIIWPNKDEFEGEFKEDKKQGFGICKIGKKIFIGVWRNNKLEGKVIIIEDGKYKKQYWENGRASKNLSFDTPISFEKYVEKYIKKEKYKNSRIKEKE